MYLVPVVITDGDYPMQSSTGTLTVRVCTCDRDGNMELCNAQPLSSSPGLSTGALIAILLCAVILLSKSSALLSESRRAAITQLLEDAHEHLGQRWLICGAGATYSPVNYLVRPRRTFTIVSPKAKLRRLTRFMLTEGVV